jgi:predicted transcriptional regulator
LKRRLVIGIAPLVGSAALIAPAHGRRSRTNREVAAELFTTVSTVEAHLTRICRKLDVRSRTDLARRASHIS